MSTPIDFTLFDETEQAFHFDESFREKRHGLLFWYRGYW